MAILDSGDRTKFGTGAVRDIQLGKGRADLLPLFEVEKMFALEWIGMDYAYSTVLSFLEMYKETGDSDFLIKAAKVFANEAFSDEYTAIIEFSIHLEDGAKKYGGRNWQKGIPTDRYIDSATRHYLKWKRGDQDERHDRACLWNLLCGAWTSNKLPELEVYPYKEVKTDA